jgi:tetratricopeptide (TPR) repeat protein
MQHARSQGMRASSLCLIMLLMLALSVTARAPCAFAHPKIVDLLEQATQAIEQQDFSQAHALLARADRQSRSTPRLERQHRQADIVLLQILIALKSNQEATALEDIDRFVAKIEDKAANDSHMAAALERALAYRVAVLTLLKRKEAALMLARTLTTRWQAAPKPWPKPWVTQPHFASAFAFVQLVNVENLLLDGQDQAALEALGDIVQNFDTNPRLDTHKTVIAADIARASLLHKLGQETAAYDALVARIKGLQNQANPSLKPLLHQAWLLNVQLLQEAGQSAQALEKADQALARLSEPADIYDQQTQAQLLLTKAQILAQQSQATQALEILDQLTTRYQTNMDAQIQDIVRDTRTARAFLLPKS